MWSSLLLALLLPDAEGASLKCPKGNKYYKEKHDNGSLKEHGCHYVDGSRDGPWQGFNSDGALIAEGSYDRAMETGTWKHWHANGQISEQCEYRRGKKMGPCVEFYENGKKKLEAEWNDGKKDGAWKFWAEDGTLLEDGGFVADMSADTADKRHGDWTLYYEGGARKQSCRYHYGEADGEWVEWYEDGTLKVVGIKKGDKWDGKYLEFHASGHKKVVGEYDQGDLLGEVRYYAPSGRETEVSNWRGGVRHGQTTSYDRDGKVYAIQCFQYGERQWVANAGEAKKLQCPDPFGILFRPAMQQGKPFSDGFAAVKIGGKWGYLNEEGRVAIMPQFQAARSFRGGMAGVTNDGSTWYAIDKTGTKLTGVSAPPDGSGSSGGITLGETDGLVDYFRDGVSIWARAEKVAGVDAKRLFPVAKDGKYGFIDATGKIAIELQYQMAGDFSEGLASVGIRGYSGYVDATGALAIPAVFDETHPFTCGMAWAVGPMGPGYIDRFGLTVTATAIDKQSPCKDGLARVKVGATYGFLHNSGKMLIAPRFSTVENFAEGFAAAPDDSAFIDRTGRAVYDQLVPMTPFSEGKAVVNQRVGGTTKYVVLKNDGSYDVIRHEISRTDSVEFSAFSEGLTAMTLGSGAGYVNAKGDVVIPAKYKRTRGFSNGLGATLNDKGWGFVKADGTVVIDHQFSNCGDFHDGVASALQGEKWGFIDTAGKWVVPAEYDRVEDFVGGLGRVWKGDAFGYVDATGKVVWAVSK